MMVYLKMKDFPIRLFLCSCDDGGAHANATFAIGICGMREDWLTAVQK